MRSLIMILAAAGLAAPAVRSATVQPAAQAWAGDSQTPLKASGSADDPARAAKRVLLMIGIADYAHFAARDTPVTDLNGPLNDIERLSRSLANWGFDQAENTRILRNQEATRAGIAQAFRWVAQQVSDSSDAVVIYFSGHGSFAPDADGDESDPARGGVRGDTQDEGLVPHDARNIHDPRQLVLDDSIRVWLASIATPNVTMIVDACYSGTISRGEVIAIPRGPAGNAELGDQAVAVEMANPRHVLITAANAGQRSWERPFPEAGNQYFGLLSYHLALALDGASRTNPASARYDDLMLQVAASLRREPFVQHPQLEGVGTARLFGVGSDVPRPASSTVTAHGQGRFALDVGAIHGVREAARFEVHAPDDSRFAAPPIGHLLVDSVFERHSTAALVGNAMIPPGSRALMATLPFGASRLTKLLVHVDPDAAAVRTPAFVAALDSIARLSIEFTNDSIAAAARIRRSGSRYRVVVNGFDLPPVNPAQQGYDATPASLCEPLTRAFAIRSFDAIWNPSPPDADNLDVQLVIVDDTVRDFVVARMPRGSQRVDTAYVGSHYKIYARVWAPENATRFLAAIVEGYTAPVAVLRFPSNAPAYQVPTDGTPVHLWTTEMGEPTGTERFKVIVDAERIQLQDLLASLPACGGRGRGPSGDRTADVKQWKEISHPLVILPASARTRR